MPSKRLWKLPLAAALLAAVFLVPGMVLAGWEWLPELLRLTPYARWWEAPVRVVVLHALCWVWLWTEGSVFQIALALLAWFCCLWALALLLGSRRTKEPHFPQRGRKS